VVQTVALVSESIPYTGGTKSCLSNQLPTLVVHPCAGGTTLRLFNAGGTYWRCWPLPKTLYHIENECIFASIHERRSP